MKGKAKSRGNPRRAGFAPQTEAGGRSAQLPGGRPRPEAQSRSHTGPGDRLEPGLCAGGEGPWVGGCGQRGGVTAPLEESGPKPRPGEGHPCGTKAPGSGAARRA